MSFIPGYIRHPFTKVESIDDFYDLSTIQTHKGRIVKRLHDASGSLHGGRLLASWARLVFSFGVSASHAAAALRRVADILEEEERRH